MAISHAQPGDVIDIQPLGPALATARTTTLLKTRDVEVLRMVLHAGKEISQHTAPGEILIQGVEGRIALTASDKTVELGPGQLISLEAGTPHAVRCLEDASFLLLILSRR